MRDRFNEANAKVSDLLKHTPSDPLGFVTDAWQERAQSLRQEFATGFPYDFTKHPVINQAMFVGNAPYVSEELFFLREFYKKDLPGLIEETEVGCPEKYPGTNSSGNTIHHLYHLMEYNSYVPGALYAAKTIVEWGGGYGNMARLVQMIKASELEQYTLIDLSMFSVLQYVYLSAVLGPDKVCYGTGDRRVQIIPLGSLEGSKVACDLFISTWAISESNKRSQDFVRERGYFGAQHFLVAHQPIRPSFPYAEEFVEGLKDREGSIILPVLNGPSKYFFL